MRISALDCLRNGGETDTSGFKRTRITIDAKGKAEYQLARKNVTSYRKRMHSAVTAFSISITLFITLSGLQEIAGGIQDYIYMDFGYPVIADYTANFKNTINPVTGRRQQECAYPIDARTAEEITDQLGAYDGTDIYGDGQPEIMLEVERIILDDKHYRELCAQSGVAYGGTILLNDYKYNNKGTERHIVPLSAVSALKVEKADGSRDSIRVDGVLTTGEIPRQLQYPNTNPVRVVVPSEGMTVRGYNWMADPGDEDGFMEYARGVLESYFPQNGMDYGEAGYTSRVYGAQDFVKIMNIAIVLAAVFLYAFVFLLGLIGILNVVSTVSFQTRSRAREFAVLQSIGMTSESVRKMLVMESALSAGKALVVGLPAGIGIVLLTARCVKRMFPIPFHMPWAAIVMTVCVSFLVMWGTVRLSAGVLKKQNIIETIRI